MPAINLPYRSILSSCHASLMVTDLECCCAIDAQAILWSPADVAKLDHRFRSPLTQDNGDGACPCRIYQVMFPVCHENEEITGLPSGQFRSQYTQVIAPVMLQITCPGQWH